MVLASALSGLFSLVTSLCWCNSVLVLTCNLACFSGSEWLRALCEPVFLITMFLQVRISDFDIFSRSGNFARSVSFFPGMGISELVFEFFPKWEFH